MKRTPFAHIFILSAFLINSLGPIPAVQAQEFKLPIPGIMVHLSPPFDPPMLKGIKVHPDNPFQFDFILDKGDEGTQNMVSLRNESTKLIKYFLASLTIPEQDLWVNLSPYEKDRIIPQSFGQTEMGRDLLAEDYMLKQITASLIYPEEATGKKFWKRVYEEAAKKFGTTNIPVNTFNKVWIVPEKAVVYENVKGGTAYVVEAKLKVMLEQDYLALEKNQSPTRGHVPEGYVSPSRLPSELGLSVKAPQGNNPSRNENVNALGSQIVREIVIPELTKEINEDKNFAQLRQVYNSLILATWYKKKIKDSILEQIYADKKKVAGVGYMKSVIPSEAKDLKTSLDSSASPQNDTERIYYRYLQAFKKGVFNYIKEDQDPMTQEAIPRKYFSGGVDWAMLGETTNLSGAHLVSITDSTQLPQTPNDSILIVNAAIVRAAMSTQSIAIPRGNSRKEMKFPGLYFIGEIIREDIKFKDITNLWSKIRGQELSIGKTNGQGRIVWNVYEDFRFDWVALGGKRANWEGKIVDLRNINGDYIEFKIRWSKEGEEPFYKVYQIGSSKEILFSVKEIEETPPKVLAIDDRLGLRSLTDMMTGEPRFDNVADLSGLSFGETDERGRIAWFIDSYFQYEWFPLGIKVSDRNASDMAGWQGRVIGAQGRGRYIEFEVEWSKKGRPSFDRVYQMGRWVRTLAGRDRARGQTRKVLDIDERLGLRSLGEMIQNGKIIQSVDDLLGLRIGRTDRRGSISWNVDKYFELTWPALGKMEADWEGQIVDAVNNGGGFSFTLEFNKNNYPPIYRSFKLSYLRELVMRGKSVHGQGKSSEIKSANQAMEPAGNRAMYVKERLAFYWNKLDGEDTGKNYLEDVRDMIKDFSVYVKNMPADDIDRVRGGVFYNLRNARRALHSIQTNFYSQVREKRETARTSQSVSSARTILPNLADQFRIYLYFNSKSLSSNQVQALSQLIEELGKISYNTMSNEDKKILFTRISKANNILPKDFVNWISNTINSWLRTNRVDVIQAHNAGYLGKVNKSKAMASSNDERRNPLIDKTVVVAFGEKDENDERYGYLQINGRKIRSSKKGYTRFVFEDKQENVIISISSDLSEREDQGGLMEGLSGLKERFRVFHDELNIAPECLARGRTGNGYSYLVIERVHGKNIDEYTDENLKENQIKSLKDLIRKLIENNWFVTDFYPSNVMWDEVKGQALLVDLVQAEHMDQEEQSRSEKNIFRFYLDLVNTIWERFNHNGELSTLIEELRRSRARSSDGKESGEASRAMRAYGKHNITVVRFGDLDEPEQDRLWGKIRTWRDSKGRSFFDPEGSGELLWDNVNERDAFVALQNGEPVGALGISMDPRKSIATDHGVFVLEGYRQKGIELRLGLRLEAYLTKYGFMILVSSFEESKEAQRFAQGIIRRLNLPEENITRYPGSPMIQSLKIDFRQHSLIELFKKFMPDDITSAEHSPESAVGNEDEAMQVINLHELINEILEDPQYSGVLTENIVHKLAELAKSGDAFNVTFENKHDKNTTDALKIIFQELFDNGLDHGSNIDFNLSRNGQMVEFSVSNSGYVDIGGLRSKLETLGSEGKLRFRDGRWVVVSKANLNLRVGSKDLTLDDTQVFFTPGLSFKPDTKIDDQNKDQEEIRGGRGIFLSSALSDVREAGGDIKVISNKIANKVTVILSLPTANFAMIARVGPVSPIPSSLPSKQREYYPRTKKTASSAAVELGSDQLDIAPETAALLGILDGDYNAVREKFQKVGLELEVANGDDFNEFLYIDRKGMSKKVISRSEQSRGEFYRVVLLKDHIVQDGYRPLIETVLFINNDAMNGNGSSAQETKSQAMAVSLETIFDDVMEGLSESDTGRIVNIGGLVGSKGGPILVSLDVRNLESVIGEIIKASKANRINIHVERRGIFLDMGFSMHGGFNAKDFINIKSDRLGGKIVVDEVKATVTLSIRASNAAMATAMGTPTGGIDLTPAKMNLQTRIDSSPSAQNDKGMGIKFHLDPAMLAQLRNAPGFAPVIISIKPLGDLRGFLGVQNDNTPHVAAAV